MLRELAEAEIPQSLLYTAGWPVRVPTYDEAALLAEVRRRMADAVGIKIFYVEPMEVVLRYQELMDLRSMKRDSSGQE